LRRRVLMLASRKTKCSVCGKLCIDVDKHADWAHPRDRHDPNRSRVVAAERAASLVAAERARINTEELQAHVAADLLDLRYERGLGERDIGALKDCATRWVEAANARAHAKLQGLLKPAVDPSEVSAALRVNLFEGIETSRKEMTAAKRTLNFIEPRVAALDKDSSVSSFNPFDLVERKLAHDAKYRKACRAASDEWKMGANWRKPAETLADITDGVKARWHPDLLRQATAEEAHDFRVGLIFNCDDVEVRRHCSTATCEQLLTTRNLCADLQCPGGC
jgi:hypothetical protein